MSLNSKVKYISEIIKNYRDWPIIFIARVNKKPIKKIRLRDGTVIYGGKRSSIPDLVYENIIRKMYNPKDLKIKKGDTVLDIGANIGISSLYAIRMGAVKIYAVEPLHENCRLIKRNMKANNFKNYTVIEKAVTNKIGKAKLFLGNSDSHGTIISNRLQKSNKSVEVRTTTLTEIIKKYSIENIDFLKIDCEGCEGSIFNSTPYEIWKKIGKISLEYHNDISILKNTEIINFLKKAGYKTKTKKSDQILGYIYAWRN